MFIKLSTKFLVGVIFSRLIDLLNFGCLPERALQQKYWTLSLLDSHLALGSRAYHRLSYRIRLYKLLH